ncbi:MAG: sialate O-acetylesterase [Pirellulaceae bacterium]
MSRFFLIATLAITTSHLLFADKPIDVFIVAGQSNAVGADASAKELTKQPIDDEILLWWRTGDPPPDKHDSISDGWQTLQAQHKGDPITPRSNKTRQWGNYTDTSGGFGPEISFARTIALKQTTPIAIIKVAFSGTHVEGDWDPNEPAPDETAPDEQDWRDSHGACYRQLTRDYHRATSELTKRGFKPTTRAMLWVQGESDANPEMAPRYEANLTEMLDALRTEFAAPRLIMLLALNTRFSDGKNPHIAAIVAAQQSLAQKSELAIYVDTDGATIANAAHFDAAGTIDVGQRFAHAWLVFHDSANR